MVFYSLDYSMSSFEPAKRMKECREARDELEKKKKKLNEEIDRLDRQLSDLMAETECSSFSCAGKLFYLSSHIYASALNSNKEKPHEVLRQNGYGDLIVENVNSRTLDSFVKERMAENGDQLPEWLASAVSVYEQIKVNMRKN